ncbi:tRNA pseudouridine synthase D [Pirellula sp. SH-Sr6A]|uniref:tRNA pseudouridine(13) synthase TruD n=1 Tax=Pirellula sp. SH-Sr6A TaxID=1632865 RepID=UPI00078ED57A|nr:tRNA pseudouridine(13) synthase TruD [Pirellula sp. SH-Sr6A]AMV35587.1 tRNA pseudouridine synthase D [Pirellula sp. SH-Sr6A]
MKLKSQPDDFQVEEMTNVRPSRGAFAFYRLEKRGIGTPEAVSAILRDWNLPRHSLSYGGLKDRHAVTSQYLTIHKGPSLNHEDRSYRLDYLGQIPHPYHARDIQANRFEICLRNLTHEEHGVIERRCDTVGHFGVVNYFDDQRFGSIGFSGDLIGASWCKGDYERTLFLAMAEENPHDRGREREQKELMRTHWGEWIHLKQVLDRSHRRSVVTYLCDHPTDFKRAVALIRQDMRSIYLAAFQSWVWNRWLSALIDAALPEDCRIAIPSKCGLLSIPHVASPSGPIPSSVRELQRLELPLPSARQKDWDPATLPTLEAILSELGMEIREMRLKYPRDTFFSKGIRQAWLKPHGFQTKWESDELHNRKLALRLSFELPKGCYATMVVRAIATDQMSQPEWDEAEESAEEVNEETDSSGNDEAS